MPGHDFSDFEENQTHFVSNQLYIHSTLYELRHKFFPVRPQIYLVPFYFGVQLGTIKVRLELKATFSIILSFEACLVKLVKASFLSIMSVAPSDGTNITARYSFWWNTDGVPFTCSIDRLIEL